MLWVGRLEQADDRRCRDEDHVAMSNITEQLLEGLDFGRFISVGAASRSPVRDTHVMPISAKTEKPSAGSTHFGRSKSKSKNSTSLVVGSVSPGRCHAAGGAGRIEEDVELLVSTFKPDGAEEHDPNFAWLDMVAVPPRVCNPRGALRVNHLDAGRQTRPAPRQPRKTIKSISAASGPLHSGSAFVEVLLRCGIQARVGAVQYVSA